MIFPAENNDISFIDDILVTIQRPAGQIY